MAYDCSMYVRALCAEIETPLDKHVTQGTGPVWKAACQKVPFCLGTDCKSLYDTCIKPASTTKEKRVALDLLDVREGIEYFKDSIRWVPTDHMLVDCLTKAMHPSLLNKYMTDYLYSFKYDDQLHATKRAAAKERTQQREERLTQGGKKQVSRASCPIGAPSSPRSMCNVAIRDERGPSPFLCKRGRYSG